MVFSAVLLPGIAGAIGENIGDAAKSYWVDFSLVPGIGAAHLQALLDAYGDVEAAWRAP
jgi:hypothetical protein